MRVSPGCVAVFALLLFATGCSAVVELPSTSATAPVEASEPAPEASTPQSDSEVTPRSTVESAASPTPDAVVFPVSDDWPVGVRDYVDFVQRARGEEFPSVSTVRFADPAAVVEEFRSDFFTFDDLLPEEQQIVLRLDDMYRALGLANEEFNLLDANRAVLDEVAAFYDWQGAEIVFPSPNGEPVDNINIVDRPVLVHELAHALQAERRLEWTQELPDQTLALALLEGEAEWIADQYLWSLTPEEWNAWNDALPDYEPGDQPEILEVEFSASYVLGGRFFHARYAEDGLAGIDDVFEGVDRVTAQMLIDPWRFSGREVRQEVFAFETPPIPDGGEMVDISWDFPMTAVNWHRILGAAVPGPDALAAARRINSFTVPAGWLDASGRLCFAIWVSASYGSEAVVEQALNEWAAVPGFERWVDVVERGYEVGGCDPGAGNVPAPRATPNEVLVEVAVVIDAETWAVDRGLEPQDGFCAGWELIDLFDESPETTSYQWLDSLDLDNLPADC